MIDLPRLCGIGRLDVKETDMKNRTAGFALAAGLATAMTGAAFAGSPAAPLAEPVIAPPPAAPVARNWTGFYGGARLGFGDLGRDVSGSGAIGGLHLGYLQDFGGFAAGVEAGFDLGDIDVDGTPFTADRVGRLGVRGGVTTGDIFAYGVAGGVRARVDGLGTDNGWYGGLGIEYALDDNWRVGGEVLHHRFSNFANSGLGVSVNTLQARVSFRF